VRQSFDLTIKAFEFSEKYRTPVILLTDEIIGHMREPVELPDFDTLRFPEYRLTEKGKGYVPFRNEPADVPAMASFGTGYRYHITGLFHNAMGFPTQSPDEIDAWLERVHAKLENHLEDILLVEEDNQPGARVAVLSYGASARTARHALKLARARGLKVDLLTLLTIWPFPEAQVEALGERVERVIVPEMNLGQLAGEVERVVGRKKVVRVTRANGEMVTPQMILDAIES